MISTGRNYVRLGIFLLAVTLVGACGPKSRPKEDKVTPTAPGTPQKTGTAANGAPGAPAPAGGAVVAGDPKVAEQEALKSAAAAQNAQFVLSTQDRTELNSLADGIIKAESLQRSDTLSTVIKDITSRRIENGGIVLTLTTDKGAEIKFEIRDTNSKREDKAVDATSGMVLRFKCGGQTSCRSMAFVLTPKASTDAAVILLASYSPTISVADKNVKDASESEKSELNAVVQLLEETDTNKKLTATSRTIEVSFANAKPLAVFNLLLVKKKAEGLRLFGRLGTLTDSNPKQTLNVETDPANPNLILGKVKAAYLVSGSTEAGTQRIGLDIGKSMGLTVLVKSGVATTSKPGVPSKVVPAAGGDKTPGTAQKDLEQTKKLALEQSIATQTAKLEELKLLDAGYKAKIAKLTGSENPALSQVFKERLELNKAKSALELDQKNKARVDTIVVADEAALKSAQAIKDEPTQEDGGSVPFLVGLSAPQ